MGGDNVLTGVYDTYTHNWLHYLCEDSHSHTTLPKPELFPECDVNPIFTLTLKTILVGIERKN